MEEEKFLDFQKLPSPCELLIADKKESKMWFKCKDCDLAFCSAEDRNSHRLDPRIIFSPGAIESTVIEKKLECSICGSYFQTSKGMYQHIGKKHHPIKNVPCTICNLKYRHKYALKFHMNQVHNKSTMVTCPFCLKSLYNKYSLKKHLLQCESAA